MFKEILALSLVILSAITSFISYDMASYQGGHANVIAFAVSMYVLTIACVYAHKRMRGLF